MSEHNRNLELLRRYFYLTSQILIHYKRNRVSSEHCRNTK